MGSPSASLPSLSDDNKSNFSISKKTSYMSMVPAYKAFSHIGQRDARRAAISLSPTDIVLQKKPARRARTERPGTRLFVVDHTFRGQKASNACIEDLWPSSQRRTNLRTTQDLRICGLCCSAAFATKLYRCAWEKKSKLYVPGTLKLSLALEQELENCPEYPTGLCCPVV